MPMMHKTWYEVLLSTIGNTVHSSTPMVHIYGTALVLLVLVHYQKLGNRSEKNKPKPCLMWFGVGLAQFLA